MTLVELMIAITLGLFVVAAGLALLLSTKTSYLTGDDDARLLETGRFAVESVTRAARQASYENLDTSEVPITVAAANSPNIEGEDNRTYGPATGNNPSFKPPQSINTNAYSSDILRLRFFGSSSTGPGPAGPDGTVTDCLGRAVAGVSAQADVEDGRGWSIFYVKQSQAVASLRNPNNQPELHCGTFDSNGNFISTAIASGVESFQALYGIDETAASIPTRFLRAEELVKLPCGQACWKKVVALKVSMMIRGDSVPRADNSTEKTELFGKLYADTVSDDQGALFDETNMTANQKARSRKLFATTIQLRNQTTGGNVPALAE